jgi:hypothetical protein
MRASCQGKLPVKPINEASIRRATTASRGSNTCKRRPEPELKIRKEAESIVESANTPKDSEGAEMMCAHAFDVQRVDEDALMEMGVGGGGGRGGGGGAEGAGIRRSRKRPAARAVAPSTTKEVGDGIRRYSRHTTR